MNIIQRVGSMSLTSQILLALVLGALLGIFLGEMISPIQIIADGYVLLLQMTVLPFITISLISGLGSLTPTQARMIFSRVGILLLLFWLISLSLVFVMPLAFPQWESASFFSTSLIQPRQSFDFLNLYIPANPFNALANNIVPAVVLFSIVLGVALIGVDNKQQVLSSCNIIAQALSKVSKFVVKLTPVGIFAISANLAGTLRIEDLVRVQIYLLTFSVLSTLLTLWILPAVVSALTPIPYREVLSLTHDALITAFMTGNLFVVLPILSEASKLALSRYSKEEDVLGMPDVIVPASFNFPHSGKVLSISFILFAAWFADVSFSFNDHLRLGVLGLLSYFGNLSAAVPYLLDLFRIPIDTFQLFLATGLVNSRFGSAAAAMHTFALAVLGTCAMAGLLVIERRKIIRFAVITVVLVAASIGGLRYCFSNVIGHRYMKAEVIRGMDLLLKQVPAVVQTSFVQNPETTDSSPLHRIQSRGKLRIGFLPDSLPYAYFNSHGKLVGLDIDMAHQLASDIGVSLEFVPLDRANMIETFAGSDCDILMSGFAVTTGRADKLFFTDSYIDEHLAFITHDYQRNEFLTRNTVLAHSGLKIGIPNVAYYINKLKEYAPQAKIVVLDSLSKPFGNSLEGLDAIAMTAERGSSWSLLYPQYSVVVPQPDVMTIPIAYAVKRNDQELLSFLNTWLELKKKDGTIPQLYDYWIMGKNAERITPRWSIIRNVLHWAN